jgi:hypothetical protein
MANRREIVSVEFYAGYKGEEIPRAFILRGRKYAVEKVLSRQRCLAKDSGEHCDLFVCCVAGETVKIIRHDSGECELSFQGDILLPS